MTEALKLTKQQRQKVFNCRTGYGIAAYKIADNCIGNFEFFIDRQNRMCYIGNGKPVEFDVQYGEDGDESEVNIVPPEPVLAEAQARIAALEALVREAYEEWKYVQSPYSHDMELDGYLMPAKWRERAAKLLEVGE